MTFLKSNSFMHACKEGCTFYMKRNPDFVSEDPNVPEGTQFGSIMIADSGNENMETYGIGIYPLTETKGFQYTMTQAFEHLADSLAKGGEVVNIPYGYHFVSLQDAMNYRTCLHDGYVAKSEEDDSRVKNNLFMNYQATVARK